MQMLASAFCHFLAAPLLCSVSACRTNSLRSCVNASVTLVNVEPKSVNTTLWGAVVMPQATAVHNTGSANARDVATPVRSRSSRDEGAQFVTNWLREGIVSQRVELQLRGNEVAPVQAPGVSLTPVREKLNLLMAEVLVVLQPSRPAHVAYHVVSNIHDYCKV